MDREKRKGDKPIPDNLNQMLNAVQMAALRQIESFGWQLKFIRRPLFQDPIPIVFSADDKQIGILEDDGRLNMEVDIPVRN